MSILLGRSTVSTTIVVFIDNLGRQLIRINNAYVTPVSNNRTHSFITWPKQMLHFTMAAAVPRSLSVTSHQAAGVGNNTGLSNYYFYDYIGNFLYCLKLAPIHRREDIIVADPVDSQLHAYIEAMLPGQTFSSSDVNTGTVCRHEDVAIGEGGSDVTRLMIGPTPRPKTWAERPN
jgi:hypothetical protein